MATIDERISELKSQGKTESTSKSLAKLVKQKAKTGGNTSVYGKAGLSDPSKDASSSSSTQSISTGSSSIDNILRASREAIRPAVESYQSAIPETRQTYETQRSQIEAEKTPLNVRFENLIAQVKGGYEQNRNLATTTTSNELGRRGILGSSGIADREMQAALSPINTAESQTIKDIGFEREAQFRKLNNSLANLANEETSAVRNLLNSIAGLESTAGMTSVGQGIQSDQFNKGYELSKSMNEYNINKPYFAPQESTDFTELFRLLFPQAENATTGSTGQTPQYTPSRDGLVEGNFISQGGRWVPRYEVVS